MIPKKILKKALRCFLPEKAVCYPKGKYQIDKDAVSKNAIEVCRVLQKNGYQAYIVGGAVRDLILGRVPKDFDVATDATPNKIKQLFKRVYIVGRRFKLAHVVFSKEIIETTTFRAKPDDGATNAQGRILNDNVFGTIEEDAARRDLTINALYYDPINEQIIDYHDGFDDIKSKTIRMIGDAEKRYREDPVRMLRVARFASKLDFKIAPKTLDPISKMTSLLDEIPVSRLYDESIKVLVCGSATRCIALLRKLNLQKALFPFLEEVLKIEHAKNLVEMILQRTDERLKLGKTVSPSFLFGSLLWPLVYKRYQENLNHHMPAMVAIESAVTDILQYLKVPLQRRQTAEIREMWILQIRMENVRSQKQIWTISESHRFRAAVDFMEIRAMNHEIDAKIAQWWHTLANSPRAVVAEMVQNAIIINRQQANKKRKRKRKPKKRSEQKQDNLTNA
ncbi:polynucleotide adenylyltransferase PcnB [Basilea psittacipulmonis]|uniref:polynucleotide adenylyltransferase PcnB n=1 Tax=Basilea psittacipulmonis TaxID=1472345 RepID=UPI00068F06D6|nr:polynucleotide adenylyltransferase PcnB [Basilea psittacipulmonis]